MILKPLPIWRLKFRSKLGQIKKDSRRFSASCSYGVVMPPFCILSASSSRTRLVSSGFLKEQSFTRMQSSIFPLQVSRKNISRVRNGRTVPKVSSERLFLQGTPADEMIRNAQVLCECVRSKRSEPGCEARALLSSADHRGAACNSIWHGMLPSIH